MSRLICLLIVVSQMGCAAMRSTPVTRQDDDSYCVQCPANGVPVVVSVPTHLKVTVYEQLFFRIEDDKRITLVNKDCQRNVKVRSEQMNTEKVIFVDVKRPAGGTLDYNLEFDSKGQSITQYESFVFDRTLEDSANLLAQLIPGVDQQAASQPDFDKDKSFSPTDLPDPDETRRKKEFKFTQSTPTATATYDANVFTKTRIVAFQIFDINAVDFEEQVQGFLAQHLNSCHDCHTNPGAIVSDRKAPSQDQGTEQSSRSQPEPQVAERSFRSIPASPVQQ